MMPRATKLSIAGPRPKYGIITNETIDQIFIRRLMVADLLSHSDGVKAGHAGWAVRETLLAIRKELSELIQ